MTGLLERLAVLVQSGDWSEVAGQFVRFWSLRDPSVRTVLAGMLLLGLSCGTLGSFIVLRRLSLLGDSLGHAVLPGVCLGFLVNKTKDIRWIFIGAVASALLGSWLVGFIRRHSRIKSDAAMGIVLSGFFGLGTVLLTRIQKLTAGSQGGLNQFLFGQASAISDDDLKLMGCVTVVIVVCVLAAFKELALTSFDESFATAIGLPTRGMHYLLMTLIAVAIVISIQAVGIVLLSAMLITPASTAYLLTDRLKVMVGLSALFGMLAGAGGACLSYLGNNWPTGPLVVVVLAFFFVSAYLFSPRHGMVSRQVRRYRQMYRTRRENLLKSVYQVAMSGSPVVSVSQPAPVCISLELLAKQRGESPAMVRRQLRPLVGRGWAKLAADQVTLTETGARRAAELVRNYRLWEQFLTREVQLPLDHVDRDAENIEHILKPELVRELERQLETDQSEKSPLPFGGEG
ncbi:MAG: metal ABC transporter permease [Planctomycetales bacterium]|nr:metal ABC transporter permease [Planctomycetales bacterium]